jgi:hypothetical protein
MKIPTRFMFLVQVAVIDEIPKDVEYCCAEGGGDTYKDKLIKLTQILQEGTKGLV